MEKIIRRKKGPCEGLLTKNQKRILKETSKPKTNSQRKTLSIIRKRVNLALQDLEEIVKQDVDLKINPDLIVAFVEAYIASAKFTISDKERDTSKRQKKKINSKKTGDFKTLGTLHKKDGSPLKKELGIKYSFLYQLINRLNEQERLSSCFTGPTTITMKSDGKMDVHHYSSLLAWLDNLGIIDIADVEKRKPLETIEKAIRTETNALIWHY